MDPLKIVCGTHYNFSSKITNLLCSNPFFQQIFYPGGGYSVKGCYIALQREFSSQQRIVWQKNWSLKVSPKVRNFMWRVGLIVCLQLLSCLQNMFTLVQCVNVVKVQMKHQFIFCSSSILSVPIGGFHRFILCIPIHVLPKNGFSCSSMQTPWTHVHYLLATTGSKEQANMETTAYQCTSDK